MKRTIGSGLLVATLMGAMALPVTAQDSQPPVAGQGASERLEQQAGPRGGDHRGPMRHPGPQARHHPGPSGLELAARLSALETYIGITPQQAGAWRAYTQAAQDFAESHRPGPAERPAGPPAAAEQAPAGVPPQGAPGAPAGSDGNRPAPQRLLAEDMADHAIARGEKAQDLKDAAAGLRAVLTPEQTARLIEAERPAHAPATTPRPVR